MATGTQRREGVTDSLAGQAEVNPVIPTSSELHIPNTQVPAAPNVTNSREAQLASALTNWMGQKWQQRADVEHEASVLDGQMAYQQGQTLEDLEMEGDKWANQGYRVMQAQSMSASLLSAQQEMIRQSQYADDPDTFRQAYVNRLNQTIEGLDPQTARMVRENMANQMPALVSQHTQAYMQNQEQNTYDTLVESVHMLSQDPSSFGELIANAMDVEGSGSQMLSADRRQAALAEGVVAAFDRMNPVAYQQLKASGVMDDMPTALVNQINAAEARFQQRARAEFNPELQRGMQEIQERIDAGSYSGNQQGMVDDMTALWAEHHLTLNAHEAGAAYAGQRQAEITDQTREVVAIQAAQARGDYATVGNLTQPMINNLDAGGGPASFRAMAEVHIFPKESGGDYNKLFNDSELPGNPFAGVRVTDMTINEAIAFQSPSGAYGQYVAARNGGVVSTPIGAYQIIGDTMKTARDGLGLTGNERLTPAMQDRLGQYIYDTQGHTAWEAWQGNDPGYSREQVTMTRTGQYSWVENVEHYGGDTTRAAIAYLDGRDAADAYDGDVSTLSAETAGYIDQLNRQMAGEDIYQTAAQRLSIAQTSLQSAQALRDGLLEQQQMTGEYELQRDMQFATQRLQAGEINYSQYEDLYNQRREARDLQQTRGTLSYLNDQRLTSITNAAKRETEAGNTEAADAMWAFRGEMAESLEAFKVSIQDPNLSSTEIATMGRAYMDATRQLAADRGIRIQDTNLNKQIETIAPLVQEQIKVRADRERDQNIIDTAVLTGSVAQLTPRLRALHEEQTAIQTAKDVNRRVESGEVPQEAYGQEIQAQTIQNWIQAGVVSQDAQDIYSAQMLANLAPDGEANPTVVNSLLTYSDLIKAGHHEVAKSMFTDGQARGRAEALLVLAGGPSADPESIASALKTAQGRLDRASSSATTMQTSGRPGSAEIDVAQQVSAGVRAYMSGQNVGWVQSWWEQGTIKDTFLRTGMDEAAVFTQENEDMLTDLIVGEAERRFALDPNLGIPMEKIVEMTQEDVLGRTSVIGNRLVVMERGHAVVDQMFGERAGSYSGITGIEQKVIKAFIADQAAQDPDRWGVLVGASAEELWFGEDHMTGETARQISLSETGVRPIGMHETNGVDVDLFVMGRDGVGIDLPAEWTLERMGEWYHQREVNRALAQVQN